MWVVGIVGGIASGKSLVSSQFQELGARWVDADRLGHEVLREPAIRAAIVDRWGADILDSGGEVDRRKVAAKVFTPGSAGEAARSFLEQLVHPRIRALIQQKIEQWERESPEGIVVLDAALLVEAGWNQLCDAVVYVDASEEARRRRALGRGWTEADWRAREAAQANLGKKREVANYTLDNSLSTADTYSQVQELWKRFRFASRSSRR